MNHSNCIGSNGFKEIIIDNIGFSFINKSKIHGSGLFASQLIHEGTLLGVLDGQVMTWTHYDEIVSKLKGDVELIANCIVFNYME